ncbi:MAG: LysM peptidoglycan-binding domain-containing protein [Acidimicrobiia bacterium]
MAWGRRLSISTVLLLVSSVAMAEPAGTNGFVPVAVGEGAPFESSVLVADGDHLWKISQNRIEQVMGRVAEPDEVASYWRLVIEVNRDQLISGDPDLIYPGEVISLPATG